MSELTVAAIKQATPGATDRVLFCASVKGFGLKVTPRGTKVFLFQYTSPVISGKKRRIRIATWGDPSMQLPDGTTGGVTLANARKVAEGLRALVDAGRDPFLERQAAARAVAAAETEAERTKQAARTVRDVGADFLDDATARRRSATTIIEYRRLLEAHVYPAIGDRPISELAEADALAVHRRKYQRVIYQEAPARPRPGTPRKNASARPRKVKVTVVQVLRDRPILANRVQQLARALVNVAVRSGARPRGLVNPFEGPRWHVEAETREALTREEVAALHGALETLDTGVRGGAVDVIRFLLYTGMRRGEAFSLRWDAIDTGRGMVRLGQTKTGPSWRPLAAPALVLLEAIPRRGAYVFPSPENPKTHRTSVKRAWDRARRAAGITKPLHALRHTVATIALSEGVSLPAVGAILGHRSAATTARYAKMEGSAARAAADVAAAAIAATMHPPNVTPIGRKRRTK